MTQTAGRSNRSGGAIGYLQIDDPNVTREEALSVDFNITYSAYQMASAVNQIAQTLKFDVTDDSVFGPIALLVHNSGGFGADDQAAIKNFLKSGNISDLDKATYDSYVTKVSRILRDCWMYF